MGDEIEVSLCQQFVSNKKNLYQLQGWCHKFDRYNKMCPILVCFLTEN